MLVLRILSDYDRVKTMAITWPKIFKGKDFKNLCLALNI